MGTKDPRADAEKYLEKHNVRGLFKHLSTKVLFAKPEDPKAFLVQELKKVQECQQEQQPVRPVWRRHINERGRWHLRLRSLTLPCMHPENRGSCFSQRTCVTYRHAV